MDIALLISQGCNSTDKTASRTKIYNRMNEVQLKDSKSCVAKNTTLDVPYTAEGSTRLRPFLSGINIQRIPTFNYKKGQIEKLAQLSNNPMKNPSFKMSLDKTTSIFAKSHKTLDNVFKNSSLTILRSLMTRT